MKRFWLITNPASGSAHRLPVDALAAMLAAAGFAEGGRTGFPQDDLPDAARLAAAGVDTLVLFAGDGTINAALCALADWDGAFLILPGGTMNLLAKELHGDATPEAILAAAPAAPQIAIPVADAGPHRAFVGIILGPAALWGRAREGIRRSALTKLVRATRLAWKRTFGRGVAVAGVPGLRARYQAILVRPGTTDLEVNGIDARDLPSIVDLGWAWLTGEWVAARAVSQCRAPHLRLTGRRPVQALFDGEAVVLPPDTVIMPGVTRPSFIATRSGT